MYMVVFKNDVIKRLLDILSNLGATGDCLSYRAWIFYCPKGGKYWFFRGGKKPLSSYNICGSPKFNSIQQNLIF